MLSQLGILQWNRPVIIYLLHNGPAIWIYWGETDNNYLLVIQCPATRIYWGKTDQWLSTCYTIPSQGETAQQLYIQLLYNAQPTGYIGVKQTNDSLYNTLPTGHIGVKQTNHYLLVIQCPTYWLHQGETVQGLSNCFTMPNLLVTSGWNRRLSTCLFNN